MKRSPPLAQIVAATRPAVPGSAVLPLVAVAAALVLQVLLAAAVR